MALKWCSVGKLSINTADKDAVLTNDLLLSEDPKLFPSKNAINLTHFKYNGFHTKHNLFVTFNPLHYLKSLIRFLIIIFARHIGFSATTNITCP